MGSIPVRSHAPQKQPAERSWAAAYAGRAIRSQIAKIQNSIDLMPSANINKIAPIANTIPTATAPTKTRNFKVGIVGAGSAGLFTAMLFDHLKKEFKLDVDYEILERNGEDRVGGRLYTYYFPGGDEHAYFDVGAMRFPKIAIMNRTYALFDQLGMEYCDQGVKGDPTKGSKGPSKGKKPTKGQLIRYYLKGPNEVSRFNGVYVQNPENVTAETFGIQGLEEDVAKQVTDTILASAIKAFTDVYYRKEPGGPEAFWRLLLKEGDTNSARQFLTQRALPACDHATVDYLETLKYGNGWYNQAFTEMVLQNLDHESQEENVEWWCVEGGAQEIAKNMANSLEQKGKVKFNKRVTSMSYVDEDNDGNLEGTYDKVSVTYREKVGEKEEEKTNIYDAVFCSVPLGAMEQMDLEGLNLNWGTKQAIRNIGYGAASKVGIRFKTMWWVKGGFNIYSGGISKTDMPLRWCVYPSYNLYDDPNKPAVLLASYTWGQEGDRIGSLINNASPENEDELKRLLIHDLARLHTDNEDSFRKLQHQLEEEYIDHYGYNWSAHPSSMGAIAYFGPGQFNTMYQWITRSNGKMMIVGEAASTHHAWVVGALDSAVRGVYQFLYKHSDTDKACKEAAEAFAQEWTPENNNKLPAPFGPLPAEYNRSDDVEYISQDKLKESVGDVPGKNASTKSMKASPVGELARHQVWIETLRVETQKNQDRLQEDQITKEQLLPLLQAKA